MYVDVAEILLSNGKTVGLFGCIEIGNNTVISSTTDTSMY